MLFQTLNHLSLFFIFLLTGFVSGFIFDIGNFIKFLFANKKIPSIILDFIQTSLSIILLFFVNLKYNFGLFRVFPIIIFCFSFFIERISLGKILAKGRILCYNFIEKLNNKLWSKIKKWKNKQN